MEKANSYDKILEYYRLYRLKKIQRKRNIINEYKKCIKDAIYFVNNYCKLKTPKWIKPIKLRDYQEDYLRHLEKKIEGEL